MDETAEVYRKTIDMAQKNSLKNIIAVKFSAMANLTEMRALNDAEDDLLTMYYKIDKNSAGNIDLNQVIKIKFLYFYKKNFFFEKLGKYLKEERKITFTEDNLKEFLGAVFGKNNSSELKITEIEWRTNVHAYYLFDKHKGETVLMKKLNTIDSKHLPLLDAYAKRFISICQRAHETKVFLLYKIIF